MDKDTAETSMASRDAGTSVQTDTMSVSDSPFGQVPIEITISVGRARPLITDLLKLARDSVLPLDRRIDDPVELFVGDRMIAKGILTEIEGDETGRLAVCLTDVADLGKGV